MSLAHANRHGHQIGCKFCAGRVKPYPNGHHSPKRAVSKGKQNVNKSKDRAPVSKDVKAK